MLRLRPNPFRLAVPSRWFASRATSAAPMPLRGPGASNLAAPSAGIPSVSEIMSYDEFSADVADDATAGLSRVLGTEKRSLVGPGRGLESRGRTPPPLFPIARNPPRFKSIRIALVGAPNAGKSTLMNALCGTKVSAVSPKFNTTRDQVLGYMHIFDPGPTGKARDITELVFVDTPGLLPASANTGAGGSKRYVKTLVTAATEALAAVDVVLLVVDAARRWDEELAATLKTVADACAAHGTRLCLVANKVDLVRHNERESEARLKLIDRRKKKAAAAAAAAAAAGAAVVAVGKATGKAGKQSRTDAAGVVQLDDAGKHDRPAAADAALPATPDATVAGGAVLSGSAWDMLVAQSKAAAAATPADGADGDSSRKAEPRDSSYSETTAAASAPAAEQTDDDAGSSGVDSTAAAAAAAAPKRASAAKADSDDAPFIVRTATAVIEGLTQAFEAACAATGLQAAIARRRAAQAAADAEMQALAREAGIGDLPGSAAGAAGAASSGGGITGLAGPDDEAAVIRSGPTKRPAPSTPARRGGKQNDDDDDDEALLPSVFSISARSSEGVDELREALLRCSRPVQRLSFEPPPPPRTGAPSAALMQQTSTSIRVAAPAGSGTGAATSAAGAGAGAGAAGRGAHAGGVGMAVVRELKATVGTDMSPQERVAEIIREKLFLNLHDEVPYTIAQRTRRWRFYDRRDSADGVETLVVDQELLVPRDSVAAMLRARQAGPLRAIGHAATGDIEAALGVRVRLFLHAVVDKRLGRGAAADAGGSGTAPRMM